MSPGHLGNINTWSHGRATNLGVQAVLHATKNGVIMSRSVFADRPPTTIPHYQCDTHTSKHTTPGKAPVIVLYDPSQSSPNLNSGATKRS
eukprot:scaffold7101_cov153-Amphora_coffeaeformis.AAC.8